MSVSPWPKSFSVTSTACLLRGAMTVLIALGLLLMMRTSLVNAASVLLQPALKNQPLSRVLSETHRLYLPLVTTAYQAG